MDILKRTSKSCAYEHKDYDESCVVRTEVGPICDCWRVDVKICHDCGKPLKKTEAVLCSSCYNADIARRKGL